MGIQDLNLHIKKFAPDIKRNLTLLFQEQDTPGLEQDVAWGVALASAYSIKDKSLTGFVNDNAKLYLDDEEIEGIKAAVTIQSVKNVYNRAIHLSERPLLESMSPHLYENIVTKPPIGKLNFHYYALACAVIRGSQKCMQQEIDHILEYGGDFEAIHTTIRIAAVLEGTAEALHLG